MRTAIVVLIVGAFAVAALGAAFMRRSGRGDELKAGDRAPAFSLAGSDGRVHSLAEYKGKQAVVLAWFPKAFTGG